MGKLGDVWDNAAMESFFSSLKIERIHGRVCRTRDEARADMFDYIERCYNPKRRHSFFLAGVATTANQPFDAASRIVALFKEDRERIAATSDRVGSALRVHDLLQQNPSVTAKLLVTRTGLTAPTVNAVLADLGRLGVVEEVTGRRRGRVFGYRRYLDILGEGTEPLTSNR